jgi:hypothetical protein
LAWAGRRLTQSILTGLHFPWHRMKNHAEAEAGVDAGVAPGNYREAYNSYALRMLEVSESEFGRTFAQRRANYVRLLGWIKDQAHVRPLFADLADDVCPYAFPLIIERGCADVVAKLNGAGVPASRWPYLPPELFSEQEKHQVAIQTYERLLLLPVHQSLDSRQIDVIGQRLRVAVEATTWKL